MGNLNNKEYIKTNKDRVLNALKTIQFHALEDLDAICKKHDITYSLSGGTCLGAIRDKGIIPWDDDIDIEMMRDQYEKFIKVAKDELDPEKYYMASYDLDHTYHSATPKLMIKNTQLRTRQYIHMNYDNPVCIDFFIYDYMPDDPVERKKITTKIYYLRVLMLLKWFGGTARLPQKWKSFAKLGMMFVPYSVIHKMHDKAVANSKGKKTGWILETAVINGNYGGMPVDERKEHIEVEFEDKMFPVMKGYDTYLRRFFGNSYMKWLPPEKRVSHHKWAECDFGPYKDLYNLDIPEDYEKYMVMKLNDDRLEHVKKLSLDMMDEVKRICDKHDINYFVAGDDVVAKNYGVEKEYSKYWRNDMNIAMTRDEFEKFDKIVEEELDKNYIYQSRRTEEDYKYVFPKIRLDNSIFRDNRTVPANIHLGLWMNIVILEKTSADPVERKAHYNELRRVNNLIRNKWLYKNLRILKIKSLKGKIMRTLLIPKSIESLYAKQERLINKYKDTDSDYYVDISGYVLNSYGINKKLFSEKNEVEFLGHTYNYPTDLNEYTKSVYDLKETGMFAYKKLKDSDPEKYNEVAPLLNDEDLTAIQKRIVVFSLGIHDHPDYILSAIFATNPNIESATLDDFEQPELRNF